MFLGEGPGAAESQSGRPFVESAPAGAELTRYCNGNGIPYRDDIYITNLVKEWAGGAKTKKQDVGPDDILRDQWELVMELDVVEPDLVVCLGRHAFRWMMALADPERKPADLSMDACHGLLFTTWHKARKIYVVPVYHPAAGLHQPDLAARTAYDMARLAGYLKAPETWGGRAWLHKEPPPAKAEGYIDFANELGLDTEGWVDKPFMLQISGENAALCIKYPKVAHIPAHLVMHNAMHELQMLAAMGIQVDDDQFDDTMVMAYLLGVEPQGLKELASRHLGWKLKEFMDVAGEEVLQFSEKTGKLLKKTKWVVKPLDQVDPKKFIPYAGADASAALMVKKALWPQIQSQGLEQIYQIDRAVLPMYARMETVGIPVDLGYYQDFSKYLGRELDLRTAQFQHDWEGLNPASAQQVSKIIFGTLGVPGGKKTPTGQWSTDDKILQAVKHHHPFIEAIIDWREIHKIKTAFVDKLPLHVGADHRLRYRLLPTRVVSGRLAAKEPNVYALPKHSELGKQFRGGVVAPHGRRLGSWDLDQIELRVLAIDSGSGTLRGMFVNGHDIHASTAHKIFGVMPEDQDKSKHRLPAKTTNFSLIMGTTEIGLAEQMRKFGYGWPELAGWKAPSLEAERKAQAEVCRQWIDTVLDHWDIRPYIAAQHAHARRYGFVVDMWGRRRYLPSVLSPNKQIREGALRQAQAFGPQAGARGIMKQIEARVWGEIIKPLVAEGYYVEPVWDIHDDLGLEFDEGLADMLKVVVASTFMNTVDMPIPITCKGDVGQKWSDL